MPSCFGERTVPNIPDLLKDHDHGAGYRPWGIGRFARSAPDGSAQSEFAEAGGLMAYVPDYRYLWRRAGSLVGRILKGIRPGDLPIEQADRFRLVINLKTAKALGVTIPRTLLLRADQVIE